MPLTRIEERVVYVIENNNIYIGDISRVTKIGIAMLRGILDDLINKNVIKTSIDSDNHTISIVCY